MFEGLTFEQVLFCVHHFMSLCISYLHIVFAPFFDLFDKMRYLIKKYGEWVIFTCGSVAQHVQWTDLL